MKFKRKTIVLMVTHACNLNCSYCYEINKSLEKVMSVDIMKFIIIKSFEDNDNVCDEIEFDFMGGEPLLEFNRLKEVSEWMFKQNWLKPYIFYATTNGTLLTDEMKEWFFNNRKSFVLGLSYDGTEYMQNINRSNSCIKIDVSFFNKVWPFQSVKMTISKETIHEISKGIIELHNLGFKEIVANMAFGVTWSKQNIMDYANQLNLLINFYTENPQLKRASILNIDIKTVLIKDAPYKYCGAGDGLVLYDVDGQKYPCHLLSPLSLTASQIENLKSLDLKRDECYGNNICKNCLLRIVCPNCFGMNFLHSGDISKRFPSLCEAFKIQILANCKIQINMLKLKKNFTTNDRAIALALKKILQSKLLKHYNYVSL